MNRGGLENRLMDIYRNINREQIQFDFLTFRNEPGFFDREIESYGGNIFYFKPINIKNFFSVPEKICTFLKNNPQYKIVHAHVDKWCGIILKGAYKAGVPVRIAHSRISLGNTSLKNIIKNIFKNVIMLFTNRYITHRFSVSKKAGCWLFGGKAVNKGKVVIWPNAIDCKRFIYNADIRNKIRDELGLEDAYTLVNVGNLHYQKNHKFLMNVFDDFYKIHPNSKLLLIGDDYVNGQYKKYAQSKNSAEKIIFLGPRSDIVNLLQAGDVFVFPSLYEGFPGSVLEAQAAGLPCIISNTISKEIILTGKIISLSVNKGTKIWVNELIKFIGNDRVEVQKVLIDKGYDIFELCKNLSNFYLKNSI